MWHDLVTMGIPFGEKAVRTIAVYVVLALLLRLAGKRDLAAFNTFDLVVMLLLSNVVQNAIIGDDLSITGGILGAAILVAANWVLVRATYASPRLSNLLQGSPALVATDGRVDEDRLRKLAITREELIAGLRRQGLELDDTIRVTVEPEGIFNATPKPKPSLDDVLRKLDEIERRLPSA
jgi:uncharacterized membrane protein YcaP (DUF421 family)